jgi:hypothetical protein
MTSSWNGPNSSAGVLCTTIRPPVATSARAAVNVASSTNAASSMTRSRALQPRTERAVPGRDRMREPLASPSIDALSCQAEPEAPPGPGAVAVSVLCEAS